MLQSPKFVMEFIENTAIGIKETLSGTAGMIVVDGKKNNIKKMVYKSQADVLRDDWNETTYKYLTDHAFKGNPFEVHIYRVAPEVINTINLSELLNDMEQSGVLWFWVPTDFQDASVSWLKNRRNVEMGKLRPDFDQSGIKMVTGGLDTPDHWAIINLSELHEKGMVNGTEYSCNELAISLLSVFAGMSKYRSGTNFKMPWIESITLVNEPGERTDKGEIVLVKDEDIYVINRAVTSFVTPTTDKQERFASVKLVAQMDEDMLALKQTWNKYYKGAFLNHFDTKRKFLQAVNAYFDKRKDEGVLDPNYDNHMYLDLEAHKTFLKEQGRTDEEIAAMDDSELMRINTKTFVYTEIPDYMPVDAMEDLYIKAYMQS